MDTYLRLKNRHQNNDYSTDVFNSDIESNFKSNRIIFIDSLVSIELYDVFSIEKKFNFSKRIKSYLTNLYSLFKKPLKGLQKGPLKRALKSPYLKRHFSVF